MNARHTRVVLALSCLCKLLHAQAGTLEIVTDSLTPASVASPYTQQLNTTGGLCGTIGTATSIIEAGALPPGLFVTSPVSTEKKWFLQGTPSAAGTYQFTVHLRWTHQKVSPFDQACVDDAVKTFTLAVQTPATLLTVDRSQITVTYHTGHFPPPTEFVRVTAGGSTAVSVTARPVTDNGGAWLSVTADRAVTPAILGIDFVIGGLQPGNYTGRVIVGADSPITIPVTLVVVTDSNIVLQTSAASLSFSLTAGAPDPPSQSLTVSVAGDSVIFQASVSAPPNGKWLTVSASGGATPARLMVAVVSKDLAPGVYSGGITLSVAGALNSSRTIPVSFTIQGQVQRPTITANGVVNAAGLGNAISPGTWVSIFGAALAPATRSWRAADFINGLLPVSLDGVSVTINGKPAAVAFVSPTQINVLAPDDTATGLVPVVVRNSLGSSDSVLALLQTAAPAFFQLSAANTNYAAGIHLDGSYVAGPALVRAGIPGTPAKPGETIVLFGTGFGATQPPISATSLVPSALPLARPEDLRVRLAGVEATVLFAGLISPGVYQFNIVVPQVDDGDKPVTAELRGLLTRPDLFLPVQH